MPDSKDHTKQALLQARLRAARNRRASSSLPRRPVRLYCPHGGSVHYDQSTLSGRVYFGLERILERFTDRLIFVSAYERDSYLAKVGKARCPHSLVRNGLNEEELERSHPSTYAGVYGHFCKLNFAVHKKDPAAGRSIVCHVLLCTKKEDELFSSVHFLPKLKHLVSV